MIRVEPECYPCFLEQVYKACTLGGVSPEVTASCLRKASSVISEVTEAEVPARVASHLHDMIRETAGIDDPFKGLKERAILRYGELYSMVRERVESSANKVEAALEFAGVGNMFDFGIVSESEAERYLDEFVSADGGGFEYLDVAPVIEDAESILILLDNTGEAPFDVVLAEVLEESGKEVWLAVKGGPVIDDITMEEARRLGLTERFRVISNGSRGVGTLLEDTSDEFRRRVEDSDLIISKGQANFETLWGELQNCVFLFVVKCSVIERATGFPRGAVLLKGGWSAFGDGADNRGRAVRRIF